MASRAELFFQEVESQDAKPDGAYQFLSSLIDPRSRADENEWREFKVGAPFNLAVETYVKKARQIWSESLSAFANSGGGILIWGIEAPNRFAQVISPLPDAPSFADRLKSWVADATEPPVLKVDVKAFVSAGSCAGFVVCCIPESSLSPHRARWADREYYIRTQDGSHGCTTSTLRRLFYPHSASLLWPIVSAELDDGNDGCSVGFSVRVSNRGSGTARDAHITVLNSFGGQSFPAELWKKFGDFEDGFTTTARIHPGQEVAFLKNVATGQRIPRERWRDDEVFEVKFVVATNNSERSFWRCKFTGAELRPAAFRSHQISRREAVVSDPW